MFFKLYFLFIALNIAKNTTNDIILQIKIHKIAVFILLYNITKLIIKTMIADNIESKNTDNFVFLIYRLLPKITIIILFEKPFVCVKIILGDVIMSEQVYDLNSKIDFTLLDPRATKKDLEKLCNIAYKNRYYSVCVNPVNVSYVKGYIAKNLQNEIKVVSVVGFPLGANSLPIKLAEAKQAIDDGADEIDFVINIAAVKDGNFDLIKSEFSKMRKIAKGFVLKVIFENCYLTENEIIKLCKLAVKYKIDFVKTSTGFGSGGATENDVKIMIREVAGSVKVKAAGGIRSRESAIAYINMGVDRIGCSRVLW